MDRPAERGLELEGHGAASRGVGGREKGGGGDGTDIASVTRAFGAEGFPPPRPIRLIEQRLSAFRLGKRFRQIEGDTRESLKTVK